MLVPQVVFRTYKIFFQILDVACGTGVVGAELREAGYSQVDGLDPSQGYLNGAAARGIFRLELQTNARDGSFAALLQAGGASLH